MRGTDSGNDGAEAQSEVLGEFIMLFIVTAVSLLVILALLNFTGLFPVFSEGVPHAGMEFDVDHNEKKVTVSAVTMGNADAVVVRGLDGYPTEDGGEPVIERGGESLTFDFSSNNTENSGTLVAVGVRTDSSLTQSEDPPCTETGKTPSWWTTEPERFP